MAAAKKKHSAEPALADAPHPLAEMLSAFLRRLPAAARLCVALSGGRDSVVLLHALSRLCASGEFPLALAAVHVHHGLSPNADAWAAFCADFCRRCALPLSIVRVEVPRSSGEGLEAAARRLRHAAFADCAADWLALAHHRDDQAETVLLNLLRGSGIAGAAGMLAERPQARGPQLVRPLLEAPRALIDDYAERHALRWIDDESNNDVQHRRNFLRHDILPGLEEKFPGAAKSLARAAGHFAEGAALLDDLAALDAAALRAPSGRVALAGFTALAPTRARNLLRHLWLAAGFRAPDTRWIGEALKQLANADALAETCVATADGELRVYRGELYVVRHGGEIPDAPLLWSGEPELPWAGGRVRFLAVSGAGIARKQLAAGAVTLRARQGGERLQLDARRPRRSLRNLLQETGVPPWQRERLPFLWCAGELAWIGGLGVDARFACAPGEAGILPQWEAA